MTQGEIVLKGGSLNKTAILTLAGGGQVIRKTVSLIDDREYGFVRWYSQMKRIQRYNVIFPDLFPQLLDVGTKGDTAFFDIEYFPDSVDLKCFLVDRQPDETEISNMHEAFWKAMDTMHDVHLKANPSSLPLYFKEEVERKVLDAMKDPNFRAYAEQDVLFLHDQPCASFVLNLEKYEKEFSLGHVAGECFTHGNVTLENVLYIPSEARIIFIDPYDENIIDCRENEYSQVLQCSKNHYGFINDREVRVEGNRATCDEAVPENLNIFDSMFRCRMENKLSPGELRLVSLFEISQFSRMLPFKVAAGDVDKAKYFYTLASKLLDEHLSQ